MVRRKRRPASEREELEPFLESLEGGQGDREIAGWESGFPNLSRVLNGILPGLYLLVGPPCCGKTALAKQLCDQIAAHNSVPVAFLTFSEKKEDLRIRTLARLSGLESGEIRRGSSYLLHWYGVPKGQATDPERLTPSWERVRRAAEGAGSWLDLIYLFECKAKTGLKEIEGLIRKIREIRDTEALMVAVDGSEHLGPGDSALEARLPLVAEQLQALALGHKVPLLATWPDLRRESLTYPALPQEWVERVASADAILVMENDWERTKNLTEPARAMKLHVAKNRRGETGVVAFDFHPAFSRFTESARAPGKP